ncbi:MAG: DUF1211 domain-containing protein [Flavobacteriales bacterium]|nr:DUF1211 domain-containing protein [Flavobacteriales bacterium]
MKPLIKTGASRLEAFSDAVFAFSATLLVVSLEVPESFADLLDNLRGFLAFGLSFMALLLIWDVHRAYFDRFPVVTSGVKFWNFVLLSVVLYYVYPMKFLATNFINGFLGFDRSHAANLTWNEFLEVFVWYGIGFAALTLCISMMYFSSARRAKKNREKEMAYTGNLYERHYAIFVLVGLLSIVLAPTGIGGRIAVPGRIYGILGLLCYAHGRWSEKFEPEKIET